MTYSYSLRPVTGRKRAYYGETEIPQQKKRTKYTSYPLAPEQVPSTPAPRGPVPESYYRGVSYIPPVLNSALKPTNLSPLQQQEEIRSLREKVDQLQAQVATLTQTKTVELLQKNFPKTSKDEQQHSPTSIQKPAQNVPPVEKDEDEEEILSEDEEDPVAAILTCIENALRCQLNENYPEAIDYWNEALQNPEHYGRAQFNIGLCFFKQNQWDEAAENFVKVSSSDIKYYGKAQFNAGACFQKQNNFAGAIPHFRNVPYSNTDLYWLAQHHLGLCHERLNKIPKAIDYYLKIPPSHAKYNHSRLHLGICYGKQNYIVVARSYFKLVTDSNLKLYETAQYNIGVDYEKQEDRPEEAIKHYKKVTKIDPKLYDKAQFRMGLCYYRTNRFELAKSKFTDVSESHERYNEAQDYIKKIASWNR